MAKDKQNNDQNFIYNPNDRFFKKLFGLASVVKGYFDHLFPKHLAAKLDLSTLELDTTTYTTSELDEYFSDIVWRCQLLGKKTVVNICFIFEHKSYAPEYPHIQIGDYKQEAYNKQLAAKQPLSVVVPIIIYHGKRRWIVKSFSDYFGDVDEEFHRFRDPYDYYLTNLQDYSDEMIRAFNNILFVKGFLAMKHYTDKAYIKRHYVELVFVGYENRHSKEILDFIRSLSVYLSNIHGGITSIEIYNQIEQIEDNLKKEDMYNLIDELKEEGIELGKKMSIYQVHLAGHDIDSLSRIFALPSAEISQIIEEMKKMKRAKGKN